MSYSHTIRALITAEPGLTDLQISEKTGITPVQQVNAVCRRLADARVTSRQHGFGGAVVNLPAASSTLKDVVTPLRKGSNQSDSMAVTHSVEATEQLRHLTPAETLIVLPCSGAKVPGRAPSASRPITALLPDALAAELTQARGAIVSKAHLATD